MIKERLAILQRSIGYTWTNMELLHTAFRHTSWCNEPTNRGLESNERLEFLGDSVMDLVVGEHLFKRHPTDREGNLSQWRANKVSTGALAYRALVHGLHEYLLLGRGAEYIRRQEKVLADLVEAIVGSAFMDGGLEAARGVVRKLGVIP